MDIRIRTTDYEITPEVSQYLDEKIAMIERTLGSAADAARCEVEIGRAAGKQRHGEYQYVAEFQLIVPASGRLVARNSEPTVNAAIDGAKDELLQQLRQDKKVDRSIMRRSGAFVKRFMRFGAES